MTEAENVKQAKESFNRIIDNKTYAGIIRDDKHLATILSLVVDGTNDKILDIGTGTGYLAFPLAQMYPSSTVYGIDIADAIIAKNQEIVKEKGITNLQFMAFDGLQYPFEEESIDLMVTRYAFHHFPNIVDAIQQMHRILSKGGRVMISDPMKHENDAKGIIDDYMGIKKDGHIQFYSEKELDELFLQNGFLKEKQLITDMKFPFPPKQEYVDLFEKTGAEDKALYEITDENGVVWIKHINVGNTVYVKV